MHAARLDRLPAGDSGRLRPVAARSRPAPARTLAAVEIRGGSTDDQSYAAAALGLESGQALGDEGFLLALAAVRATDRFRTVEGVLEEDLRGLVARVDLDPWPAIEQRELRGDLPRTLRKNLFTGMHKGGRAGDLRIRRWQVEAEQRLQEAGYPGGPDPHRARGGRRQAGDHLEPGTPARVRSLEVEGEPAPYTAERLRSLTGVKPGKSLWTTSLEREARIV